MGAITKIVGRIVCGVLLYLGLFHVGQTENAASAAYELSADQSDHRQGRHVSEKREVGPLSAAKTIKGNVLRIQGENLFVKRKDGNEVRVHVDKTTQMGKNIEPGEPVEVKVNDQNHALSILSGAAVTDRRDDKE
jgi:uncharacterized protein YdeI (BOF family)